MNLTELYEQLTEEKQGKMSINRERGIITVTNEASARGFDCYRLTGETDKDSTGNDVPLIEQLN